MSSPKNPEEVLWSIFPLLLIASVLVAGIILLPKINQTNLDDRSRASEPSLRGVVTTKQSPPPSPEVVCSDLYEPVCGSDNKTYPNPCEANLAKVPQFTPGECSNQISLPSSN